jgi:cytochrome c553
MKRSLIVPSLIGGWVAAVGLLLIGIVLFGPYTHNNLDPRVQASYARTNQISVGPPDLFGGMAVMALPDDPVMRGQLLFVSNECASCHGLRGQGSVVGPGVIGTSAADLRKKTTEGAGAMPAFDPATLSDDDLAAIAAFLSSEITRH